MLDTISFSSIDLKECPDEELVAAVCAGDEGAYRELFERYRRMVTGIALRYFSRREVIEEIVQITFAEAWLSIGKYQYRGEGSFIAWLSRITHNTCYDELRGNLRRKESNFSELGEDDLDYLENGLTDPRSSINAERSLISRDLVYKLLKRLDSEDRVVLVLLKVEEWSIAEISTVTGWSPAKIKMRVHRARGIFNRARRRLM